MNDNDFCKTVNNFLSSTNIVINNVPWNIKNNSWNDNIKKKITLNVDTNKGNINLSSHEENNTSEPININLDEIIESLNGNISDILNKFEDLSSKSIFKDISRTILKDVSTPMNINEIPRSIDGVYNIDYNIINLHKTILRKFEKDASTLTQIKNNKKMIEEKLKKPMIIIERKNLQENLKKLENEIKQLENNYSVKNYLKYAIPWITKYLQIGTLNKTISFNSINSKSEEVLESNEKQEERHYIIYNYLEIAKKYIEINLIRDLEIINKCSGCGMEITEESEDDYTNFYICPNCKVENEIFKQSISTNQKSNLSKSNYEDRENFHKAILRYQGKQDNKLPYNWIEIIDRYFNQYPDMPNRELVKYSPLQKDGVKASTNRKIMELALTKTGLSDYYKDLNLICHLFWGWKLNDISSLENELMNDYDESQKVLLEIKEEENDERSSSLNVDFRLYQHLRNKEHECNPNTFKTVKTDHIVVYYVKTWKKLCKRTNGRWKYFPI
jgi:predicted RNA-binding Zn-ribbon protein involved in translation (DUF1610 family)